MHSVAYCWQRIYSTFANVFFINVRFFLLFTFYSFFERFCIYALGSIGSSETMNDFVGFKLILHLRIYNCYV